MSRYGDSAIFEERERSVYAPGRRSARTREYDEIDVESRRSARPARSVPDFLHEDYDRDRTSAALVIREGRDDYDRPRRRPERERVEKEEIIIRDEHRSPAPRARTIIEDDDVRSVRSARTARTDRTARLAPRGESRTREEIDIKISRDESEDRPRIRNREPAREVEDEEVIIRRTDTGRARSAAPRDDISFRRGEVELSRPRHEEREKEEIIIRRNRSVSSSRSPPPHRHRDSSVTSERVVFKPRDRSLPPRDRIVAREREEFVVRRRKPEPPSPSSSPSPPPPRRDDVKEEIIIRRTEREPSPPTPPPAIPSPEPELEPYIETVRRPIVREEIHRDIITHYRNYDHGTEYVRRDPTPPPILPPEPEPVREEKLEVAIRRTDENGETEEDIIIEDRKGGGRRHRGSRSRAGSVASRRETIIEDDTRSVTTARSRRDRSFSPVRGGRALGHHHHHHHGEELGLEVEADYYNRKALERARPGEAYNGATREWELVDVPPGTSRVKMDGIGGGAQEITWQRYNGARRSRFTADGQDYVGYPDFDERHGGRHRELEDLMVPPPPPMVAPELEPPVVAEEKTKTQTLEISIRDRDVGGSGGALVKRERKPKEMWTEITKDLVIKEAIEEAGYGYEETEDYFYVMEYLRYEDVEGLVRLSDHIRRQRKHRIKQIELEREAMERVHSKHHKERDFEEEIIYERRRRH